MESADYLRGRDQFGEPISYRESGGWKQTFRGEDGRPSQFLVC